MFKLLQIAATVAHPDVRENRSRIDEVMEHFSFTRASARKKWILSKIWQRTYEEGGKASVAEVGVCITPSVPLTKEL